MAEFEKLQQKARESGARGANLGHVLARYGGSVYPLRLKRNNDHIEFVLAPVKGEKIQSVPLFKDSLSGIDYFFAVFPLEFLHHDDRINPRGIGSNIRGLIEEFMQRSVGNDCQSRSDWSLVMILDSSPDLRMEATVNFHWSGIGVSMDYNQPRGQGIN
ncbi:MAG: hypothetical protein ABSG80_08070 [Verrucomicrobiota bacterium]|jgi:hypothetical protein